jgi:DNA-binding transcriptional regulator YiaG
MKSKEFNLSAAQVFEFFNVFDQKITLYLNTFIFQQILKLFAMVKYVITIFILSIITTLLYQQPSCSASSRIHQDIKVDALQSKYFELGKNIKKERLQHRIGENDFCQLVGISQQELQNIEQGKKMPNKAKLYKIEEILETTFEIE